MKKRILICVSLLLAAVFLIGVYAEQSSKIVGDDGLIAKARKEINNLAEAETIEMIIAGKSTIDNNRHMFWIITGNKYQMHRYYPLEVTELKAENINLSVCTMAALKEGRIYFLNTLGADTRLL